LVGRLDRAYRHVRRTAQRHHVHLHAAPTSARDYLELVTAIEATAEALGMPVVLEGYEPPSDPRLQHFRITPDPGVIEVNIHPAELGRARRAHHAPLRGGPLSRLTTEKFMLDGRHTGTGGGNHFVLGGATPSDSPFLRRPDLLRSLISYWHNHPSAVLPVLGAVHRPDQPGAAGRRGAQRLGVRTRNRLQQFPKAGRECVPPWLIDRLLRNLLIDVTGNTHRAEFCIDKLYSPDGPTGRLGLLELRAFEMPPHARMSLAQQLLLRGLIARFWARPTRPSAWCAGAPSCTTASCCRTSCSRTSTTSSPTCGEAGFPLESRVVCAALRVPFPEGTASSPCAASSSSCAARSNPGM
jgi:uncharacterized protein (DUF2126 family)